MAHKFDFIATNEGFKVLNGTTETQVINQDGTPGTALGSHRVVFSAEVTWTGSGASLATTVTGALATDIIQLTIQSAPTQAASVVSCAVTADTVTTTLSAANTSNDAVIAYTILRANA